MMQRVERRRLTAAEDRRRPSVLELVATRVVINTRAAQTR